MPCMKNGNTFNIIIVVVVAVYPFSDQKGPKTIPFGEVHTPIWLI